MTQNSTPEPWQLLADAMKAKPVAASTSVIEFFAAIKAPPHLAALERVAKNLSAILPLAETVARSHPAHTDAMPPIAGWLDICQELVRDVQRYADLVPKIRRKENTPGVAPLRKEHDLFPLYALCWYRIDHAAHKQFSDRYVQLQAQLFVADLALRTASGQTTGEKDVHVSLAAYRIAHGLTWLDSGRLKEELIKDRTVVLAALPCTQLGARAYIDGLWQAVDKLGPHEAAQERIRRLANFLKHGLGTEIRSRRKDSRSASKAVDLGRATHDRGSIALESDPGSATVRIGIQQVRAMSEADERALVRAGCSRDESGGRVESITTSAESGQPMGGRDVGDHIYHETRHGTSWIAMHNQQLPCSWNRLSRFEQRAFVSALRDLPASGTAYDDIPAAELAAALATIFLRSCSVAALDGCRLERAEEESAASHDVHGFRFKHRGPKAKGSLGGSFVVPPGKPKAEELSPQQQPYAFSIVKEIEFHSSTGLEGLIDNYVLGAQPAIQHGGKLFPRATAAYETAANKFLTSVRRERNCRLTLARVARCLFDAVAAQPGGDLAAAMIVFARNEYLGTVPLHYTALGTSYLRRLYREACRSVIGGGLETAESTDIQEREENLAPSEKHAGSRYRPRVMKVQNLAQGLRSKLETALDAAAALEPEPVRNLHNAFVTYTVMLLMYATGYRAVTDPMFSVREIDFALGLACISDKGDHHARLVCLPPSCLKQLDYYGKHVIALRHFLFQRDRQANQAVGEFLAVTREEKPCVAGDTMRAFFLERNSGSWMPVPVQPSTLEPKIGEHLPLPLNANRHHLRSQLLELGCDRHVVDGFMGHWERGREPWGRFSALPPIYYKQELVRFLKEILSRDGWLPRPGLGHTP